MNDVVLAFVFAGDCVSRLEKTREYEKDEAIRNDTGAKGSMNPWHLDKPEAAGSSISADYV
jgi:hypothetical protein